MSANGHESHNGNWDPRQHPDWENVLAHLVPIVAETDETPSRVSLIRNRLTFPYDSNTAVPLMDAFFADVKDARATMLSATAVPPEAMQQARHPEQALGFVASGAVAPKPVL